MKALIAGSFDPVTLGHEDLIRRAAAIFGEIVVLIGVNPAKSGTFSYEERAEMIRESLADLDNLTVVLWDGLLAEYCIENGIRVIVKGIRDAKDLAYENGMAQVNADLCPGLETVYLPASPVLSHVSSTVVRELVSFGVKPAGYVSGTVLSHLENR